MGVKNENAPEQLRSFLKPLEEAFEDLKKVYNAILGNDKVTGEVLDGVQKEKHQVMTKFLSVQGEANALIATKTNVHHSPAGNASGLAVQTGPTFGVMHAPKLSWPKFSGSALEYQKWSKKFRAMISRYNIDDQHQLAALDEALEGNAKCLIGDRPVETLEQAMTILENEYASSFK